MKKWLIIGAGVLVLGAMVFANLKRSSGPKVEARLGDVRRGDVTARISAPGRVSAVSAVDISAEVPGRIVELAVEEGDKVRAGDLLLRLNDAQYASRVEQAEAALASARAGLNLAEAQLEKLTRDRDRLEVMYRNQLTSEEAVERVRTDHRVQVAQVEAKRQDVARTRAATADARDDLNKTVYRAPASGVVSRLNVEQGEIVITGTMNNPGTVILTIADLSEMEVEAEVDETDVVTVAIGQRAEISVDAIPDTTFDGLVVAVGNSGRQRGQGVDEVINFEVVVRFDSGDPRLKPGMTADVEIETSTHSDILTVPIQSLVARTRARIRQDREAAETSGDGGAPPDTLDEEAAARWDREILEGLYRVVDDRAEFVEVRTGIADESRIEVSGDLAEGDRVVIGPFKVLRELREGTWIKETKRGSGEQD